MKACCNFKDYPLSEVSSAAYISARCSNKSGRVGSVSFRFYTVEVSPTSAKNA